MKPTTPKKNKNLLKELPTQLEVLKKIRKPKLPLGNIIIPKKGSGAYKRKEKFQ